MALPVALPITAWGGLTILHCCHVGPCNTAGVDRPARHEGHRPFGQAPTCQCEGQRSDTMPRMRWTVSLGVFLVWVQFVAAGESLPLPCDGHCPAKCHCEPAYSLSPGCCEPRRHCFDNAWDGYCQERARWDAVWYRVGTRTSCSCSCAPRAIRDSRGMLLDGRLPPAADACGCQGAATAIPAAQR